MTKELPKTFQHNELEQDIYKRWEDSGLFTPEIQPGKTPYVITMPPPNAYDQLHIGHALFVTIEDIMEELVGEIEDEYDAEESELEILPDGSYLIDGDTEIDILNDKYDLQLPEGDYETIAGLIINRLARIPKNNTRLELRKYSLLVNKVTSKKIKKVKLIKKY